VVITVDSTWYLAPLILGYAIVVIGSRLSLRGARAHAVDRKEFLTFAGLAAVGAGSAAGLLQGTPLLANWFTDARNVGYLVAAVTLVSPLYLLPRVLGLALFPAMSHARGEGAEHAVRRSADLSMRGTMVGLAPVFAAALPLAGPILAVYGGGQYADGAPELRLLLLATYTAVVAIGPINALSSGTVREARIPVTFALLGCLLGLLLVAPLGWAFGGAGVAAAYLVATVLTSAGPMAAAARKWTLPWTGVVVRSALAIGAGLAITAGADVLHASWALSLATALVCGGVAAAILALDGKALLTEVRA
jgi:O-antigen/teichoic acid export membrane protein